MERFDYYISKSSGYFTNVFDYFQVGLSEPHRIGQASEVKIVLKGRAPMQTDGEPWIQGPAEINLRFHKKVPFLRTLED